jgi:DNA modification methylase
MKIQITAIEKVIPYARNPRRNQGAIAKVAASIKEFGWKQPIVVDPEMVVIAGHTRLAAAHSLGMAEVPILIADDLTQAQIKAYRLADNRVSQEAEWDHDLLTLELQDLVGEEYDLDLTGFSDDELAALLAEETEGLTDEDAVPEVPENPVTVLGDVWILGDHRLMCGDSTSVDAVEKLMAGEKVDMVFTDPPYNMAFNGRSGKHDVIKNDNLSEADFNTFIDGFVATIHAVSPKVYYVWCNWKFYGSLQDRLDYKACIVWAKNVFGMGKGYRHQHEFCLFNGSIDDAVKNESDLWSVKKDTNYSHPTQKPVELSVRAFGNHIKLVNVLDLFGGSGSTLIGAEQTRRRAFVMELDPKYCDVIVKRWQDFTGKKAVHAETGEEFNG